NVRELMNAVRETVICASTARVTMDTLPTVAREALGMVGRPAHAETNEETIAKLNKLLSQEDRTRPESLVKSMKNVYKSGSESSIQGPLVLARTPPWALITKLKEELCCSEGQVYRVLSVNSKETGHDFVICDESARAHVYLIAQNLLAEQ